MRHHTMRHIARTLILLTCLSVGSSVLAAEWKTLGIAELGGCASYKKDCVAAVKSRHSQLSVLTTAEAKFDVLVNTKRIATLEGYSVSIEEQFSVKENDIFLLAVNSGGMACPMELYIIQVANAADAVISPSFGTCSDYYLAQIEDGALVVKMPSYFNPMHLKDLNESELKAVESRKGTVFRWLNSRLSEKSDVKN
jgi:hypothetical protein